MAHLDTKNSVVTYNNDRKGWRTEIVPGECDINTQQETTLATFWGRMQGSYLQQNLN